MRRIIAAVMAAALLAGCSSGPAEDDATLTILAGSELSDLAPVLDDAAKATGVTVDFTYAGTLDGVRQVVSGQAAQDHQAIWFSSNRYLDLHGGGRVTTATPIMSSPVVVGVRPEAARRLGWDAKAPTWAQIARAAVNRDFTYGMTSPAASNSGFSALVGLATALNSGSDLDPASIEKVSPGLKDFFSAQTLTSGSSGWLSEVFVRKGVEVDGLVNYESVITSLNASGRLTEPLTVVYPSDGVVTADYPLSLLPGATPEQEKAYRALTDYLLRPETQRKISELTHRRPVVPSVPFTGPADLRELPFPGALETVDRLIAAFYDRLRRPSRTVYVIDVSGSMTGERIAQLKRAFVTLTGDGGSGVDRFYNREEVTVVPFSTKPQTPQEFTVPASGPQAELQRIRRFAEALRVGGGTAIYDSLTSAYEIVKKKVAADPDRFTSIVLMTDGENTQGRDFGDFRGGFAGYAALDVPVFPVLFGEAKETEMRDLAALTGGRSFDARKQPLETVFREIRGYQ
ncbi:substrate-binding and VWA domain-containing protein [Actinocorallia sp. API 0066]|uniref:vWA domain-containing protein n=1 Tax=Actinocorallia sp. API 0066 TaxID=2896846 RepID=UPI001E38203D|nr:substrate-binding and VWA domain-containing protein [Actinocorallia sp. API 0066]MCD0451877.1 substrate-binding and VWA domain-containing protein [Actinocorallia sp. API 0066]